MARNTKWQDDYWLLLMQIYLQKPVGMKPMYSRKMVDLSMELHIPPTVLFNKMCQIANTRMNRDGDLGTDDREKFDSTYRVFFRGCGDRDQFLSTFLEDDAIVKEKGVREDRRLYRGGHVWGVWRECLRDFVPQLFR